MNPFLESTAGPVAPCLAWGGRPPVPAARSSRAGRHAWRRALGVMLFTAAMGMAPPIAHALDVNQATAQQLETLRGIGPRTAELIVSERERGGKFESFEDLAERVRGIGQKKAQALQAAGLRVGQGDVPDTAGKGAASGTPAKNGAKPPSRP